MGWDDRVVTMRIGIKEEAFEVRRGLKTRLGTLVGLILADGAGIGKGTCVEASICPLP